MSRMLNRASVVYWSLEHIGLLVTSSLFKNHFNQHKDINKSIFHLCSAVGNIFVSMKAYTLCWDEGELGSFKALSVCFVQWSL